MRRPRAFPMLLAGALACAGGCAHKPEAPPPAPAPAPPAPPPPSPQVVALEEADRLFARRGEVPSAEIIAAYQKVVALEDGREVRLKLARAEHFAARTASTVDEKKAHFAAGVAHAEQALKLEGQPFEECPQEAKDALALYWLAQHLYDLSREEGLVDGTTDRRRAACVAALAEKLDGEVAGGGLARLLGRVLGQQTRLEGGDLARSKEQFERALRLAPALLQTRVDYADSYAVKKQDKALFEELLNAVLVAPTDVVPELAPENRLAKDEARALLAREAELF